MIYLEKIKLKKKIFERAPSYYNICWKKPRYLQKHQQESTRLKERFTILKKCRAKFECLIYEMLLIKEKKPTLKQTDSIPAKLFT